MLRRGKFISLGPIFDGESKKDNTWAKSSDSLSDQRGQRHQSSKSSATTPSLTVSSQSKSSTLSTQKPGPKPLFPSGFLPRNLRTPINKNVQKPGVEKTSDLPLPKKRGYFPRNMQDSRSRSRSSERSESKTEVGMSRSSSKREVIPPSKGKFTTQNWSGLESNNTRQSKEKDSLITTQPQGRGRGRGNMNYNNRGRGGVFNPRGRGRGFRGRGVGSGGRGRGIMAIRGRGFVARGRGRGVSKPPVGATVRNIFRRSKSRSPVDNKYRKSSRSPISPRRDRRSRSPRRKERGSRSRSSSFCSTCSSHSCSTCRSWRSGSLDRLSGKGGGDGVRKKKHKTKTSSREEKEKNSAKAVDKLKSDIKSMEKQLEQKTVKNVEEKKRDVWKGNLETKTATEVSKADVKDKPKPGKLKDKQSSAKDLVAVKEEKDKNSKEVTKDVKKKTDNVREVILKSDKRKESPKFIKKEKDSPVREVKIVNEKKTKGGKSDEKSGSKMKIDTLKITIDQQEKMPDTLKDTRKDKRKVKGEEKPLDSGKRSSRSPSGKQKKKEKVKSKKAKKKAKKKKNDGFSGDSDDESFYSSISGQDEFSGNDERFRSLQAPHDKRIVEFSSAGAYDTNSISVHYAKRGNDPGRGNSRKSQNLISIPLPKEPEVLPRKSIPQNVRKQHPKEQRFDHPLSKEGQTDGISNAHYSDLSASMESESGNVDWETAKFANEFQTESALGEEDYGSSYQESENVNQVWATEQGEGGDPNSYYYEEGAEGEGYEQEHYSYPQEEWQTGNQEQYEEWYEGEHPQEGAEGEAGAGYEGEYYLGEDGLYYPVEGDTYQETQDYQGEYIEGGAEGEVLNAGQGAGYAEAEEEYQYQFSEEGGEWQQYDEAAVYQTEEGWNQGEAEGQWQEEYQEGYQGTDAEWGAEYIQGNELEACEQGYAVEDTEQGYTVQGTEMVPQEGYNAVEGYDQQFASEEYYMETIPPQIEGHHVEHDFQPQPQLQQQQQEQQQEELEPLYQEEPLVSKNESKDLSGTRSENKVVDNKPLKSILKKAKPLEGNGGTGSKLVSERLAQMRKQTVNKVAIPQRSSSSASSAESVEKKEQNPEQEGEKSVQSESERYREMEEAILSSQPKDAVGTEYVVRVHGSGAANFYCKLCQCHFNTLTAKNLHIKGMKHIELYIRLKSSLLQSVIRDTKVETAKRPVEGDPPTASKVPRRF